MEMQPQLVQLLMREQVQRSVHHHCSRELLPKEAQQLKDKILRTRKNKLKRFSMSYMKKRVVPPIQIPKEVDSQRAFSATVSGRKVPLTRCMWNNTKRMIHRMEQISEGYPLRCTLYR